MIIENVWSLATKFVDKGQLVTISNGAISDLAKSVSEWKRSNTPRVFDGMPSCIDHYTYRVIWSEEDAQCVGLCAEFPSLGHLASTSEKALQGIRKVVAEVTEDISKDDPKAMVNLFLYELIANSVNYCYWYGKHSIRPNKVNCLKMYALLDESFDHLNQVKENAAFSWKNELEIVIDDFIKRLSRARFPLLDYRIQHLHEILSRGDLSSVIEISVIRQDYNAESWLDYLVTSFPGYSKDLFLKRAFLFVMQMYRRCGWFAKDMDKILVPADYQIPKMLRWLGCLEYHSKLASAVDGNTLLPEGGQEECEIRAATIVACKKVAEEAECTCEEVDSYLFSRRNWCTHPFHLTITSNY